MRDNSLLDSKNTSENKGQIKLLISGTTSKRVKGCKAAFQIFELRMYQNRCLFQKERNYPNYRHLSCEIFVSESV